MRLELICEGLLVYLANHYTIRGAAGYMRTLVVTEILVKDQLTFNQFLKFILYVV